ncbi:hypothetical protein WA026_023085 [Henosepilachna vigintioctopunctata]|uniref:Uncharacterized protein n=1 Tax=Henosepilachna vigintioctopunctata TaxID=420089 RepID=A0AAW1U7V2_9CUCU
MEDEDFFISIEEKMELTIPPKLRAHIKYHDLGSVHIFSELSEEHIKIMEEYARNSLHKIIQPDQMKQYYGERFQDKPEQFIFTIGERFYLYQIKRLCEKINQNQQNNLGDNKNTDISNDQINAKGNRLEGEFMENNFMRYIKQFRTKQGSKSSNMENLKSEYVSDRIKNSENGSAEQREKFSFKTKGPNLFNRFRNINLDIKNNARKFIHVSNTWKNTEKIRSIQDQIRDNPKFNKAFQTARKYKIPLVSSIITIISKLFG